MDTGVDYDRDIEFTVSVRKHLSGDIILTCQSGNWISSGTFLPDGDISVGLELLGKVMRNHYIKINELR